MSATLHYTKFLHSGSANRVRTGSEFPESDLDRPALELPGRARDASTNTIVGA